MPGGSTKPGVAPGTGSGPKGPSRGATGELRRFVDDRARAAQLKPTMPKRYKRLSAIDLYQQFLTTQPDAKGIIATGYGYSGLGLSVSVEVNPADAFTLPGLVNCSVGAEVSGSLTSTLVVVVHRIMPRALYDVNGQPQTAFRGTTAPVCFMALFGKTKSFQAGAGVSIGVGKEMEIPVENEFAQTAIGEVCSVSEITLGLNVAAEIGGNYRYDRLTAIDPAPGWYVGLQDTNLQADFHSVLLPGKTDTKRELLQWISTFNDKVYPLSQRALSIQRLDPRLVQQDVLQANQAILNGRKAKDQSTLYGILSKTGTTLKGALKGAIPQIPLIYEKLSTTGNNLLAKDHTTDELLAFIQNLKTIIPTDQQISAFYPEQPQPAGQPVFETNTTEDKAMTLEAMNRMRVQLEQFEWRLMQIKALEARQPAGSTGVTPRKIYTFQDDKLYNKHNCFLKIASHSAEGEAGVSATGGFVTGQAGINGKYKRTAYRYQTFTPSRNGTLLYTQDTSITYRQASIGASAGVVKDLYGREINKSLVRRGMTYQSACVYWQYEPIYNYGGILGVECLPGSGLSFGASVEVSDLVACIREINASPAMNQASVNSATLYPSVRTWRCRSLLLLLAKSLRISVLQLIAFLDKIDANALQQQVTVPALLLESNFALMTNPTQRNVIKVDQGVKNGQPIYRLESLLKSAPFMALSTQLNTIINAEVNCLNYLQTIQLRARMADFKESEIPFKLGVPLSGTDIGITLTKIQNAGQEGLLNLYSRQYQEFNPELGVPPVAIFHQ